MSDNNDNAIAAIARRDQTEAAYRDLVALIAFGTPTFQQEKLLETTMGVLGIDADQLAVDVAAWIKLQHYERKQQARALALRELSETSFADYEATIARSKAIGDYDECDAAARRWETARAAVLQGLTELHAIRERKLALMAKHWRLFGLDDPAMSEPSRVRPTDEEAK